MAQRQRIVRPKNQFPAEGQMICRCKQDARYPRKKHAYKTPKTAQKYHRCSCSPVQRRSRKRKRTPPKSAPIKRRVTRNGQCYTYLPGWLVGKLIDLFQEQKQERKSVVKEPRPSMSEKNKRLTSGQTKKSKEQIEQGNAAESEEKPAENNPT